VTVDVSLDAVLRGAACGSDTVPGAIASKFARATSLLQRAYQESKAKTVKRLRGQAKQVLGGARKAARRAAKGKKPKLSDACATAIQQAVADVTVGL
jgi:cell division septum initiation protein DivIVA